MWFERNFIRDLEDLQGTMDDFFNKKEKEYKMGIIPVNIYENKEKIFVALPVAGIPKENITLNFQNGNLTIQAKKVDEIKDIKRILRKERKNGDFIRNIQIEQPIEPDSINAKYLNGFLMVELTKKEETKAKKITID